MSFIILFKDKNNNREQIEKTILDAIKQGHDFASAPFSLDGFQTLPVWPTREQISSLSFNVQIEEVEIKSEKLESLRKRIIDVEDWTPPTEPQPTP